MPLEDFYREYAGLWQHTLDTRFRIQGRLSAYVGLLYALAARKVTLSAMRRGMRLGMANMLAKPQTFLDAHEQSQARMADVEALLAGQGV